MADEEHSRSSAGEDVYEPEDTGEDYEGTLDEEEALEADYDADELKDLEDEGEMSIEELRKKYGLPSTNDDANMEDILSGNDDEEDADYSSEEIAEGSHSLLGQLSHVDNDTEDVDDDNDYEPPNWWYKAARVDAVMYQADVPQLGDPVDAAREDSDALLWVPTDVLSDDAIDSFICSVSRARDDVNQCHFDDEDALYALFVNSFDVDKAKAAQPFEHINLARLTASIDSSKWDPMEIDSFEAALNTHGKDFNLIKARFPNRKLGELVHFYYKWKKTDRYNNYKRRQLQPDIDYHTFTASILNPHHPPHPGHSVNEAFGKADVRCSAGNDISSNGESLT